MHVLDIPAGWFLVGLGVVLALGVSLLTLVVAAIRQGRRPALTR